jgi:hypothetical protein
MMNDSAGCYLLSDSLTSVGFYFSSSEMGVGGEGIKKEASGDD